MSKYLSGFNFIDYLKRHSLIGQVDPWRIDDDGKPYFALLTALDTAIAECKEWAIANKPNKEEDKNEDIIGISKTDFKKYLLLNNILTLNNIEDLVKLKAERKLERQMAKEEKKKHKRTVSPERRIQLQEHAALIREKGKALTEEKDKASVTENA